MSDNQPVNRRKFLGAGLAGLGLASAGAATGWALTRRGPLQPRPERPPLGGSFTYDVSAFQTTDPKLLLYDEAAPIPTGCDAPRCIEMAKGDVLYLASEKGVKTIGPDRIVRNAFTTSERPQALAHIGDGRIAVGCKQHIELRDAAGALLATGPVLGEKTLITSMTFADGALFVADAGSREVVRCDLAGKPLARFGRKEPEGGNPGFSIPSAYFDIELGPDGLLWVTNTGRHQIEAYTTDGKFELGWGETGMAIENFCGCCNPVHFSRLPDGRFVTGEKGLNRIKIYDPRGAFVGVVAGVDHLVKDLELARRACADCRIGFGFDVACDSSSRVFALDPASKTIRVFTPKAVTV